MTSLTRASASADERNSRTIHTAACLIIGDEVLGGKVGVLAKPIDAFLCVVGDNKRMVALTELVFYRLSMYVLTEKGISTRGA